MSIESFSIKCLTRILNSSLYPSDVQEQQIKDKGSIALTLSEQVLTTAFTLKADKKNSEKYWRLKSVGRAGLFLTKVLTKKSR